MTKQTQIPKAIALMLVSICTALLMLSVDSSALAKLDSMSATDYVQRQRELFHHSFIFHFFVVLILGGFYIGAVEVIAYVIGSVFKKSDA